MNDDGNESLWVATNLTSLLVSEGRLIPVDSMWCTDGTAGSTRAAPSRLYYRFTPAVFAWLLSRIAELERRYWQVIDADPGLTTDEARGLASQLSQAAERLPPLWEWAQRHGLLAGMPPTLTALPRPAISAEDLAAVSNESRWVDAGRARAAAAETAEFNRDAVERFRKTGAGAGAVAGGEGKVAAHSRKRSRERARAQKIRASASLFLG